jgi:hypothetical protein
MQWIHAATVAIPRICRIEEREAEKVSSRAQTKSSTKGTALGDIKNVEYKPKQEQKY